MKKPENSVKFPERIKRDNVSQKVYETVEEAGVEAVRQAAEANVSPSSVMVTAKNGYATGDGVLHSAKGITASKRVPQPSIPGNSLEEPTGAPERTPGDVEASPGDDDLD